MLSFISSSMQPVSESFRSISTKRYMPLNFNGIHGFSNTIPYDLSKYLPKFSRNHENSASHHVQLYSDLVGDFEIAHEDIQMKLFVQTLEDDARDWFLFLPACSISSWDELLSAFMMQFGERVSISDYFDKFLKIQIRNGELVLEFNIRFAKILNEIPESYKPDDQMCLVVYLSAFDQKMSYLLRDKEPKTLHQAFMTAIEIENNIKYGLTRSHFSRNICQQDEV